MRQILPKFLMISVALMGILNFSSLMPEAKAENNPDNNPDHVSAPCVQFPSNTRFSEVKINSAVVSWQTLGNNYQYQVGYKVKNTATWLVSPVISSPTTTFTLVNLVSGTDYDVQVRSKCKNEPNFGAWAKNSLGFKTLVAPIGSCAGKVPTIPSEIKISKITLNNAVLKWKNIPDAAGSAIVYGLASESPSKWKEVLLCKSSDSLLLKDLLPNSLYRVRIRTLCNQCTTQNGNSKKIIVGKYSRF